MGREPIIIIGAGLVGLTLGQCLRRKSIPTLLLEKLPSPPAYNYGITLHPWSYRPLLNILQSDEVAFRRRLSVDSSVGGNGALFSSAIGKDATQSTSGFRCHRGRLEELLREGQNIRWDHEVQNVTSSTNGILLELKDREPIEVHLLISTDGVHSQVRRSLAPQVVLKVLPYVVFNGKRRMALDHFRISLQPEMQSSAITRVLYGDVLLEVSVNDCMGKHVDLSYTYSRPAHAEDHLYKPDRAPDGATDIPEAFYDELSQLHGLQPAFAEIFDAAKVKQDRLLHWLMRSSLCSLECVKKLAEKGILLAGDAVHAMPILGGEGANVAIGDGVLLAEHLHQHGSRDLDVFLEGRYGMWQQAVTKSEQTIADMHSLRESAC